MSYNIKFTDQINNNPLTVNDNTINTATSLGFPGRNQKGYAVTIAEDLLHLLENFANTSAPSNPIKGQLWYDSAESSQNLMVYDGTSWKSSGSLKKGTTDPLVSNSIVGDLWVNTSKQQLYLFNGGNWTLVGPTFSSSSRGTTGIEADIVEDSTTAQTEHSILKLTVDSKIVSIISLTSFTPKSNIEGFTSIKKGLNVSNLDGKFWGTSEKAENLVIGGQSVSAVNFLRSDVANIATQSFTIKNNSGLNLGDNSQLQIRVTDGKGVVYHSSAASKLELRVNYQGNETALVTVDSTTGNVGIGSSPSFSETLTVNGSGSFTKPLLIKDTTDSTDLFTGSLIVDGGVLVKKKLRVTGEIVSSGQITSKSIIPIESNKYDLGSETNAFANIYATKIHGEFAGNITGNVNGNITGSASRLVSTTLFSMAGDVTTTDPVSFDGTAVTQKVFNTKISGNFINNQKPTVLTANTDEIMIYRPVAVGYVGSTGNDPTASYKTSKSDFLKNLSLVPVGAIFPFAGTTVPSGYLLCDGSEKLKGKYNDLYNVIGDTYTPNPNDLVGLNTFKIPDLRGRFPLGLLEMDNGDSVPKKTNTVETIDSGGGIPNDLAARVSSSTAATLGNVAGFEQITLNRTQLPEHQHELVGESGQYYAINNNTEIPTDTGSRLLSVAGNTSVQALPKTGGIDAPTISQAVNITNPYLTINYIIYSGVHNDI
jgi:hypothetical protein